MYRCSFCDRITPPRQPRLVVLTEQRQADGWQITKEHPVCVGCEGVGPVKPRPARLTRAWLFDRSRKFNLCAVPRRSL